MSGNRKISEIDAITALYDVSRAATSSLDLRLVVSETLEVLTKRMGVVRGMLVLRDPGSDSAGIEAAHGLPIPATEIWLPVLYGSLYAAALLFLASYLFARRDF